MVPTRTNTGGDMGALLDAVTADRNGIQERRERERSRMTHQLFLLAESGMLPAEHERRTAARHATSQAWMTHIAAHLGAVWPSAPADVADKVEKWFGVSGERREVIELELAHRVASGPIDDLLTRERRVEYGGSVRWLAEAIGATCDPTGSGGPEFAKAIAARLDAAEDQTAARAAEIREPNPDDVNLGEQGEMVAHIEAICDALEAELSAP